MREATKEELIARIKTLEAEVEDLMRTDYWQDRHNIVKKELDELKEKIELDKKFAASTMSYVVHMIGTDCQQRAGHFVQKTRVWGNVTCNKCLTNYKGRP